MWQAAMNNLGGTHDRAEERAERSVALAAMGGRRVPAHHRQLAATRVHAAVRVRGARLAGSRQLRVGARPHLEEAGR